MRRSSARAPGRSARSAQQRASRYRSMIPSRSSHAWAPSVCTAWSAASNTSCALRTFAMFASPAIWKLSMPASKRAAVAVDEQLHGLKAGVEVGDRMLDRLLGADRLVSEHTAVSGALQRAGDAVASVAARQRGHQHTLDVGARPQRQQPLAFLADQSAAGDVHVVATRAGTGGRPRDRASGSRSSLTPSPRGSTKTVVNCAGPCSCSPRGTRPKTSTRSTMSVAEVMAFTPLTR